MRRTLQARVGDEFDSLRQESSSPQRKIEINQGRIEIFRKAFERLSNYDDKAYLNEVWQRVRISEVAELERTIGVTAQDIEQFSLFLGTCSYKNYLGNRASIYFINLMLACKDEVITIHTNHLPYRLFKIGAYNQNTKIHVYGDLCDQAGYFMNGGLLHIHGNARVFVGFSMKDGEIIVDGEVGREVGKLATGGVIRVEGYMPPYFENPEKSSLKIFHEGKLVVENGKRLK